MYEIVASPMSAEQKHCVRAGWVLDHRGTTALQLQATHLAETSSGMPRPSDTSAYRTGLTGLTLLWARQTLTHWRLVPPKVQEPT